MLGAAAENSGWPGQHPAPPLRRRQAGTTDPDGRQNAMASQVPTTPVSGGDDYFMLLRKARQRRTSGARLALSELTGLTDSQRKSLLQAQALADRFETELDARQKALDDARKARQQQSVSDRRKAEQAEAARKLEKARKEMERLKTQAQTAAAAGDVERARSIAQAVKGVLREISTALRTLHSAAATAFLTGEPGAAGPLPAQAGATEGQALTGTAGPTAEEQTATDNGTPLAAGQEQTSDTADDPTGQPTDQRQDQQNRTTARPVAGADIDPVLIEAQGDAAKAVAIARQIVAILRAMRPRNPVETPDAAPGQTDRPASDAPAAPSPDRRQGHRNAVEQMSADVEGLALSLALTSGQTLNIQT